MVMIMAMIDYSARKSTGLSSYKTLYNIIKKFVKEVCFELYIVFANYLKWIRLFPRLESENNGNYRNDNSQSPVRNQPGSTKAIDSI